MMNIRNLGSKESVGVKFKEGIYTELCLKLWFESNWYFCKITESGWFWKRRGRKEESPKQLLPKVTSEIAVRRCSSRKVFLEISQYSQENNCPGVSF